MSNSPWLNETLYLATKGYRRVHVFRPSDHDDTNGARNLVTKCTVVDCSSEGTELLQRAMICDDIANTSRPDFSECRVSRQKHELTLIASRTGDEYSKTATLMQSASWNYNMKFIGVHWKQKAIFQTSALVTSMLARTMVMRKTIRLNSTVRFLSSTHRHGEIGATCGSAGSATRL